MTTLESLQAKIQKLQAQAEALAAKKSSAIIEKIRGLMAEHGLTTADIDAHVGRNKRGPKPGAKATAKSSASAAKYRDPKTGATWTGHGRAPAWISSAKDRSKFLVQGKAVVLAPAVKKVRKAGNYVRGPQAPKYRDPKTGATWSGRGPAPAWLAGAKDRTKFLIAGTGDGTAEPNAAAEEKAAPMKKAAAKKSVAKKAVSKKSVVAAKKVSAKKVAAKKGVVKKAIAKKATSAKTSESRKAPAKKTTAKKVLPAANNKASTNKVSMTAATVNAPMATVESGDGAKT